MADVVRCEVHLDAILVECAFGYEHHTGAVDDNINCRDFGPGEDFIGSCTYGALAGKIELESAIVDL